MEHGLLLQRTIRRGRHCRGGNDDIAIALSTPGGLSESDGPSEDCLLKELCGSFIPYTPEYEKDVDVVMTGLHGV
jgi:hypothetical protein